MVWLDDDFIFVSSAKGFFSRWIPYLPWVPPHHQGVLMRSSRVGREAVAGVAAQNYDKGGRGVGTEDA